MTTGELITLPVLYFALLVSASGALYSCANWGARFWFFIAAPPLYFMLWFIVGIAVTFVAGVFTGLTGIDVGSLGLYVLTTMATLAIYVLNCAMLRGDGARGVRMMASGGGYRAAGREPSWVTHRRFELH